MDGELRAQGLRKRYGPKEVVRGVDLALRRGEIVALFGPNGAGKTTTFYMVVGFIRPTGGGSTLRARRSPPSPCTKGPGSASATSPGAQRLPADDRLGEPPRRLGVPAPFQKGAPGEGQGPFGGAFHLPPAGPDGLQPLRGERRRLEIARALATDPDFLLLDEPFTGVDPKNVREIQKVIAELRERRGVGVFITDHAVRRPWPSPTGST